MTSRRGGWRRARPQPKTKAKPAPKLAASEPHLFERDPLATREPYTGLETCKKCKQLGAPGDPRHTVKADPPKPVPAHVARAWREHDEAILGESGDD